MRVRPKRKGGASSPSLKLLKQEIWNGQDSFYSRTCLGPDGDVHGR